MDSETAGKQAGQNKKIETAQKEISIKSAPLFEMDVEELLYALPTIF